MKTKIICVVGPTASGKTSLSVELAKQIGGEIISADSMQVYKNMPIASAVATKQEQQNIPHYLTEFLDNDQSFSVAEFVKLANEKIQYIVSKNKVPIIVGGTGLFVDSLVKNIQFKDISANDELRQELEQKSNEELYEMLLKVDENSAKDIHQNNRKRVVRALELYYSGSSKTQQNIDSTLHGSNLEALYIGINYINRDNLYARINKRVDIMVENGLIEEAKQYTKNHLATSSQAIGHKELMPFINNEITLQQATDNLKQKTRNYAKRQLTWFRKNQNINWLYADELNEKQMIDSAVDLAQNFLKGKY